MLGPARAPPAVNLISSTAARYDPAGFMRAVGVAYRESGRKRPIISTFGHNPYPINAAEPPWVRTTIPRACRRPTCRGSSKRCTRHSSAPASRCRAQGGHPSGTWRTDSRRLFRRASAGTTTGRRPTTGPCPRRAGWHRAVVPRPGEPAPRRAPARSLPEGGRRVLQLRADRRRPPRRLAVGSSLARRNAEAVVPGISGAVDLVQSGDIDCSTVPGAGGPIPEPPPTPDAGSPG